METTSLVIELMRYFGKKDGQTLMEFKDEVLKLTDKDRRDFCEILSKETGKEVLDGKSGVVSKEA